MQLLQVMWVFGFCLLHAQLPHTHTAPVTPLVALTAAPKAMPHAMTLCFGSQKPLTPEHQCPQAAEPESPSRRQGLGNGPHSPALQKQKRKTEQLPLHDRQSRAALPGSGAVQEVGTVT